MNTASKHLTGDPGAQKAVAVVTGASRGIGAGIAEALASRGYDLALCCLNNYDRLVSFADELHNRYGACVYSSAGDVSDEAFVEEFKSDVSDRFHHTDVVVNNAGISYYGLLCDMTFEEWQRVISVNLSSCFLFARAFCPDMVRRRHGHIIQITSVWGVGGASCEVAYSASKAGMAGFTRALARELAPSGVAVNAIACGVIDTDMNKIFSDEEKADLLEQIPAMRFGTPQDVGECVASLCRMPYVTGQVIGVDGGFF